MTEQIRNVKNVTQETFCIEVAHIPEEPVITDNWQDLGATKLGH